MQKRTLLLAIVDRGTVSQERHCATGGEDTGEATRGVEWLWRAGSGRVVRIDDELWREAALQAQGFTSARLDASADRPRVLRNRAVEHAGVRKTTAHQADRARGQPGAHSAERAEVREWGWSDAASSFTAMRHHSPSLLHPELRKPWPRRRRSPPPCRLRSPSCTR